MYYVGMHFEIKQKIFKWPLSLRNLLSEKNKTYIEKSPYNEKQCWKIPGLLTEERVMPVGWGRPESFTKAMSYLGLDAVVGV